MIDLFNHEKRNQILDRSVGEMVTKHSSLCRRHVIPFDVCIGLSI